MNKVATVKVDSYDCNYEDVEKGVQESLALLGGLDKFWRTSVSEAKHAECCKKVLQHS